MTEKKHVYQNINEAYFSVIQEYLFMKGPANSSNESYKKLDRHTAILDVERDKVFSVVTQDYQLITNEQAVKGAKPIFEQVFSGIQFEDMKCLNIVMPKTRSFCHIDLVHTSSDFSVWGGEEWTPFIRVTNSYNKTKKIRYEIGFCRWICMNGVIFGAKSIEVSSTHSLNAKSNLKFDNIEDIRLIEAKFIENLVQLKRYYVPKNLMFPLVLKVFEFTLQPANKLSDKRRKELLLMRQHITKLSDEYVGSLGEHGYAALNVLSDFASRPKAVMSPENSINSYQSSCGNWIGTFVKNISNTDFNFTEYLKEQVFYEQDLLGLSSKPENLEIQF